jgi:hypothetical protein
VEHAQVKRTLYERMTTMLREQGDPRALGNAEYFETIKYTGPKTHSYENWLKNQRP